MNRLSKQISMAIALVYEPHNSQFDKGGKPYVLHNSDRSRLEVITEKYEQRFAKYESAMILLKQNDAQ